MYAVRNDRDCRIGIFEVRMFEKEFDNLKDKKAAKEFIVGMKREIREYLHRDDLGGRYMVRNDYDSSVVRFDLPEGIESMKAAEDWFDDNERIVAVPSQYDCTGQLFTAWHRIFKIGNKFRCYHCIAMDV